MSLPLEIITSIILSDVMEVMALMRGTRVAHIDRVL